MSEVKYGYKSPESGEWVFLAPCTKFEKFPSGTEPHKGFKPPDIHMNESVTFALDCESHIPDEWLKPITLDKKIETAKDVLDLPEGQYTLDFGENRIVSINRFENKFVIEWNDGEKYHKQLFTDIGNEMVEIRILA